MGKIAIPLAAGVSVVGLAAAAAVTTAMNPQQVTVTVDGESSSVTARADDTVAAVLQAQGVGVRSQDVVMPAPETLVTEGMEITVVQAKPLGLLLNGRPHALWTTADTVDEALGYLNLAGVDAEYSVPGDTEIGPEGINLQVRTAKRVTVSAGDKAHEVSTTGTVADALAAAGISPDGDDIVAPALSTPVKAGMTITHVNVEKVTETKEVEIPFEKKTEESDSLDKGTKKVTTEGVKGVKVETYENVKHNGRVQSSQKVKEEVKTEPVDEVTSVGTREKEEPQPEPTRSARPEPTSQPNPASEDNKSEDSSGSGNSDSGNNDSGNSDSGNSGGSGGGSGHALDLSREAQWVKIAECESNNRWNINTGNGYYGGLQFNLQTWRSVNGQDFAEYPHQATREEQITVANRLYAKRGFQPWSCARVL